MFFYRIYLTVSSFTVRVEVFNVNAPYGNGLARLPSQSDPLFVAVDAAGFISQSGPWLMLLHVLFVTWFTYEDNALFQ